MTEPTEKVTGPCIGLDLGTTYSCVAYYNPQSSSVEIIANDQGNRITPSYVAFTETERLVGNAAKNQASRNIENTIYDIKRLMGRTFDDPVVQEEIKRLPYKVVNRNNKPVVQVMYKHEQKEYTPEQISAMIIEYMTTQAENYLGKKIKNIVITVPSYFTDAQRQATKDAGAICKMNVLRIINEPTAASLCYGLGKTSETRVLIFDTGGGTMDATLLEIDNGAFEVLSTSGDGHLGGEDFDQRMVDHFVQEFKRKNNKDISKNQKALSRLKTACQSAKHTLSASATAAVEIDSLQDGVDFNSSITRARFNDLCADLFQKCLDPVEKCLKDAGASKDSIHEVVLVGGSTRVPKLQQMLRDYFNGKELNNSVNPDEAVAYGASIQANILSGETTTQTQGIILLDVCPLTLGIETNGQIMTPMIPRNSTIPIDKKQTFSTFSNNQTAVTIKIMEGERKFTKDCNLLGEFTLSGIPPAPRGVPQIEIKYSVSADGLLTVTATESSGGKTQSLAVDSNKSKLSKQDIERMVSEADKFKEDDEKKGALFEAKSKLESYAYHVKNTADDEKFKEVITVDERKLINEEADKTLQWLEHNGSSCELDEIESHKTELEKIVGPIVARVSQQGGVGGMPDMGGMGRGGMPSMEEMAKMAGKNGMPSMEEMAKMAGKNGMPSMEEMAKMAGSGGKKGPTVEEVD
jgi:heat shock protein 1/8